MWCVFITGCLTLCVCECIRLPPPPPTPQELGVVSMSCCLDEVSMNPQFTNQSDSYFQVDYIMDPRLTCRYIRDALRVRGVILNDKGALTDLVNYAHCSSLISLILGEEIAWKYVVQLRRLQEKENLNIPNELRNANFNFRHKLSKVFIVFISNRI